MSPTARSGTLVERYLFSPLYAPRSAWAVLGWWERRRLLYNIVVGTAGLATTATAAMVGLLVPGSGLLGPQLLMGPIVYGIAANLFYSLGAPVDLLLRRWLRHDAGPVAQALFRYGLGFAVGLTLLPIPMLLVSGILQVLNR